MTSFALRPSRHGFLGLVVALSADAAAAQTTRSAPTRPDLPPLHHESVAFDAGRGRIVVVFSAGDSLDGTWEWDGRAWTTAAAGRASTTTRASRRASATTPSCTMP